MPRAKGGSKSRQRRKKIMKMAKGYVGGRGRLYSLPARRWSEPSSLPIGIAGSKREHFAVCGSRASARRQK